MTVVNDSATPSSTFPKAIERLQTGCHGITVLYDAADRRHASIVSDMKEPETPENAVFNAAVDALESVVLAHFCAGVDVSAPAYLKGIETAYQAMGNHL